MIGTTSKRQQEIIESAGKLLMEKGIKGLTTKNLALEMQFSESALYRHFKNKEDIIVLLLEYLENNLKHRLNPIYDIESTAHEKLFKIFNSQFVFFSQNPHFVVAILSEGLFDESDKINHSILKIINYKTALITACIEDAKKNSLINDAIQTQDMVHILMGSFRLMMLKWKISKFKINLIQQGNNVMKTNLNLIIK